MTEIIPKSITAGVNFLATATLPAFGDGWELFLYLRGVQAIDLASTRSGSTYTFEATPAETSAWAAGAYAYTIRATDGADVVEVESGRLSIIPDLVSAGPGYDPRSEYRKVLEAIEAVLAKRATLDQERYRINNRELYRTPIRDLLALRDRYWTLVQQEEARASGRTGWRQVKFHMRPMGSR